LLEVTCRGSRRTGRTRELANLAQGASSAFVPSYPHSSHRTHIHPTVLTIIPPYSHSSHRISHSSHRTHSLLYIDPTIRTVNNHPTILTVYFIPTYSHSSSHSQFKFIPPNSPYLQLIFIPPYSHSFHSTHIQPPALTFIPPYSHSSTVLTFIPPHSHLSHRSHIQPTVLTFSPPYSHFTVDSSHHNHS
jgi:hypothetical protein